jgi:hypothetical protein
MVMRLPVSFSAALAAVAALALCAGTRAQAQSTAARPAGNGTYIASDPLANVRYDNRFDVSLGMAYDHMKAGPNPAPGANLGGLDLSASYWFSKHWALKARAAAIWAPAAPRPTPCSIKGPFVSEYFFTAGPEWLGPHNKHGAMIAHVLVGGVYGDFEQDLRGESPSVFGFYNNQVAPAAIIGRPHRPEPLGALGLPRHARRGFDPLQHQLRAPKITQTDVNFAISVGVRVQVQKRR